MKIAIFIQEMSVGGVTTLILNLCRSLVRAGHAVTVMTLADGEWASHFVALGVKVHYIPSNPWIGLRYQAPRLADYLAKQQVDLFMVNLGIERLPMLSLAYLPDQMPVLLTLHGDQTVVYNLAGVNGAAWNCAVGVSPKVQQVTAAHFPAKPVHCILPGIALPTVQQLKARRPWALPLRLLFVGRLVDSEKGIFRLPAIVAGCRENKIPVRLTVIGDGPDFAHLAQLFAQQGVDDWVEMGGFQSNQAATEQMRAHHLLLMPSNTEALGMVVQEALANGCVPIASHIAGVTDVTITDGSNGTLVEATNLAGFVEAIGAFLVADRWRAYSQAAIAHAHEHYGAERMGDHYLALFEELRQGAHPLPITRTTLRTQGGPPFTKADFLPPRIRLRLRYAVEGIRNRINSHQ